MKTRVMLITLCAVGVLATTAPAEAGPLDRRISPTAVAPRPIVVDTAPAQLTYSRQARSEWQLTEFDRAGNSILATHVPSGITISIDYDDPADDRHAAGVAPDTGCGPMEGGFWGSTTPLFYPILEPETHTIDDVTVAMAGDEVRVFMSGGSYNLVQPGAGDEPLFMDAVFSVEDGQLRVHTSGLHYVLPSKTASGTTVDLTLADGSQVSRTFTPASPTGREYFDNVRLVEVTDPRYGNYSWTTDIQRLQYDLNTNPLLDVFEIDADHALKDRGQKVVTNDFTFAKTCG